MFNRALGWARGIRRDTRYVAKEVTELKDALRKISKDLRHLTANQEAQNKAVLNRLAGQHRPLPPRSFLKLPESMHAPCPICGEGETRWTSAYPSYEPHFHSAVIFYCAHCGSGFVPDGDSLIEGYYEAEYSVTNRGDRDIPPEVYFGPLRPDHLKGYFDRAEHQLMNLRKLGANMGRVLDYGSGPGYLLHASSANEKYAVELDGDSDKYLDFIGAKKLAPRELPQRFFDVIVASHVVEHFTATSLERLLKSMLLSLNEGGLLLIEVPHGGLSYVNLKARQDPHTIFFTIVSHCVV